MIDMLKPTKARRNMVINANSVSMWRVRAEYVASSTNADEVLSMDIDDSIVPYVKSGVMRVPINATTLAEGAESVFNSSRRIIDLLVDKDTEAFGFDDRVYKLTTHEVLFANKNASIVSLPIVRVVKCVSGLISGASLVLLICACGVYLDAMMVFLKTGKMILPSIPIDVYEIFSEWYGSVAIGFVIAALVTLSVWLIMDSTLTLSRTLRQCDDHRNANATIATVYVRLLARRNELSEALACFVEEQVRHFHEARLKERSAISVAVYIPHLTDVLLRKVIEGVVTMMQVAVSDNPDIKRGRILTSRNQQPHMTRYVQTILGDVFGNDVGTASHVGSVVEDFLQVIATDSQNKVALQNQKAQVTKFVNMRLGTVFNSLEAILAQTADILPYLACIKQLMSYDATDVGVLTEQQKRQDAVLIDFSDALHSVVDVKLCAPQVEYCERQSLCGDLINLLP